jgi:hypothetical protein
LGRRGFGASVGFAAVLALLAWAPSAHGTLPGPNGKIAFSSDRAGKKDVWVMNADGTTQGSIQSDGVEDFQPPDPAWAPNGREIAFAHESRPFNHRRDLFLMEADGGNLRDVGTPSDLESQPTWAPDGGRIAYVDTFHLAVVDLSSGPDPVVIGDPNEFELEPDWSPGGHVIAYTRITEAGPGWSNLFLVDPDGGQPQQLTTGSSFFDARPSISPDGSTVVFTSTRTGGWDLYTVPIGGGTPTRLTNTPTFDEKDPVWSPDGTKIAFAGRNQLDEANWDIYTVDPTGTDRTQLTTSTGNDTEPDWQRVVPGEGFPRPKGATPVQVSLVPAYRPCTSPNRTHGPPLAFGSCNPPNEASGFATVGTPDANGNQARSVGFLRVDAQAGNPATPADEADIRIRLNVTDVRRRDNPAVDYSPFLFTTLSMQLTDQDNGCCGFPATLRDGISLYAEAPCAPTPDPAVGSTCSVTTTADAYIPGMVREGQRGIWQMREPVQVFDSGPDGSGADATLFAVQGIFIP